MTLPVIEDFKPMERNTLRGFLRVWLPSGMVVHDMSLHVKDGKAWVSPPGRPMVGRDGTQIRDSAGKGQFNPTISFTDRATQDKFSEAIVAAVRTTHPGALT